MASSFLKRHLGAQEPCTGSKDLLAKRKWVLLSVVPSTCIGTEVMFPEQAIGQTLRAVASLSAAAAVPPFNGLLLIPI